MRRCLGQGRQVREGKLVFQILLVEDDRELNQVVCAFLRKKRL